MNAGSRRPWWMVMAVAVSMLMLLGACSGDDDTDPDASVGQDGDDGGDAGAGDGDASSDGQVEAGGAPAVVVVDDVEADGDALMPCAGVAGQGTIEVAYLQVGDPDRVGPLADAFRAALSDYNGRCGGVAGGELRVAVGYGADACTGAVRDALVVVTDAADAATVDCLVAADRAVWHEAGVGADGVDGPVTGTDAPPAERADTAVAAALAEGVIGDRPVVVVHDDSARAREAVDDGVVPALAAGGVEVLDTLTAPCGGAPLGRDLAGAFVVAALPAPCLADLTAEVDGVDVRWLVLEDRLSLAPEPDLTFAPDAFDTALAYEFASTPVQGLPRDRAPVARDRACVEWLDGFTGNATPYPSAAFTAHARLCSTLAGLVAALHAAGSEPTAAATVEAVAGVGSDLLLAHGQVRGAGGDPWLAPRQVMTLEWNADCGCWTHVRGPDAVPVDAG